MAVNERPVLTYQRFRNITGSMIIAFIFLFFVGFGFLFIFLSRFQILEIVAGVVIIFIGILFAFGMFFLSTKFEFYEHGFRAFYRGKILAEMSYSSISRMRYYHNTANAAFGWGPARKMITLTAWIDGEEKPFLIDANPRIKSLGMTLAEWLRQKIPSEGGRVE